MIVETYSEGFKLVREKVAQKYNTSSAEDELKAADFRRKHPALGASNQSFENLFKKRDSQPVQSEELINANDLTPDITTPSREKDMPASIAVLHRDKDETNRKATTALRDSDKCSPSVHFRSRSRSVQNRSIKTTKASSSLSTKSPKGN